MWGNTFCQLLNAVLLWGQLLSGMVLCAETERERLCRAQPEKGTISPSLAQNGQVLALISFLCPRKISSKLCPEWRAGAPSRQLGAVLQGDQLSPCVAQPQQGGAAKTPLCPQFLQLSGFPEVKLLFAPGTAPSGAANSQQVLIDPLSIR